VIDLDFELTQGTFAMQVRARTEARVTVLFGASGAGKTTTLEVIAGLRRPSRGKVTVDRHVLFSSGERIDVPPHRRRIGYVPQEVALFPHLNVRRNLLYGRHPGASPTLDRVGGMLEIDGLLDRRVGGLSGGDRQRVALGRALMSGPSLLLLDEPLAAVDVPLRRRIIPYLNRVRDELQVPIVYVTHDRDEVHQLADVVVILEAGRVTQIVSPDAFDGR
jgi:molybdate transport system ATP-binding protein